MPISYKIAKKVNPPWRVCPYNIRNRKVLKIISSLNQWQYSHVWIWWFLL